MVHESVVGNVIVVADGDSIGWLEVVVPIAAGNSLADNALACIIDYPLQKMFHPANLNFHGKKPAYTVYAVQVQNTATAGMASARILLFVAGVDIYYGAF